MKSFKLYLKLENGAKAQLTWIGALLIIIGIVIVAISVYNYFMIPKEALEEFAFSPHALIIKEVYLSGGIIVLGILLLLAGAFAAPATKEEKEGERKI